MNEESFYQRHRQVIRGISSVGAGALITVIGFLAITAGNTADQAKKDVKVLKQASPCLAAKEDPTPKKLALCHRSFGQAVALVTSPQACLLFLKGAPLLVIDGKRVREVQCLTRSGRPVTAAGVTSPSTTPSSEDRTKNELGFVKPDSGSEEEIQTGGSGDTGGSGGHDGQGGTGGNAGNKGGAPKGQTDSSGGPGGTEGGAEGGEEESSATDKAAIGLEVLSDEGPVIGAEVLPDVLPLKSCNGKLLNLNC